MDRTYQQEAGQREAGQQETSRESRSALRCERLVKRFGEMTAVDGLDLEVVRGECFGLLGPNGAGKTTTVEILEGLQTPDGGRVEVLGCEWGRGRDQQLRTRLGVSLQETQLAEKLTVEETVTLFRSFYPSGRTANEAIDLVELDEKRSARVGKLSGGQKQRLAIACALVGNPELVFLDEPTTGLDPQARLKLWEIVENFKREGGTVLLTTHYMEEAARLCDRLAVMDRGRIIAQGTPAELIRSLGGNQIIELSVRGTLDERRARELPGILNVHRKEAAEAEASPNSPTRIDEARLGANTYTFTVAEIGHALPALLAEIEGQRIELASLVTHEATLEDVFVSLTGRMLRDG